VTRTHTTNFRRKFSCTYRPTITPIAPITPMAPMAASATLHRRASASVGASIYCARTRTAHTRFCSANITSYAHPYFWPEAITLPHAFILAGGHRTPRRPPTCFLAVSHHQAR
jgi:hypothetical protein